MFVRSKGDYKLESYGNLNTGARGVGGTDIGYTGGEITLKIVRSGNTVTTYYKLGEKELKQFSALVIDEQYIGDSDSLKVYFAVNGGGISSSMEISKCKITQ